MKTRWRPVVVVTGLLTVGLVYLLSDGGLTAGLAQTPLGDNGLPTTTSTGRTAIGGPSWVRPSQLPPNWEKMDPNWLFEEGGEFGGWHLRGIPFPRGPRAPLNPGSVFPSVTPGTPGPSVPPISLPPPISR